MQITWKFLYIYTFLITILEGGDIIYEEIIIYAHFHYWSLLLFNCMIQYAIMQWIIIFIMTNSQWTSLDVINITTDPSNYVVIMFIIRWYAPVKEACTWSM